MGAGWAGGCRGRSAQALTLLAVVVAWVPFRADGVALDAGMLRGMAGLNGFALPQMIVDAWPPLAAIARPVPVLMSLGEARTLSLPEVSACLVLGWIIVLSLPHVHELSERARGLGADRGVRVHRAGAVLRAVRGAVSVFPVLGRRLAMECQGGSQEAIKRDTEFHESASQSFTEKYCSGAARRLHSAYGFARSAIAASR